jgi:hypothetical protein
VSLKIRRDAPFISTVLFTIALGCLIPPSLANARAGRPAAYAELGPAWGAVANLIHELGVVSLSLILIGLIVTWTGYVHKVRWTWFVMFIIVWGWAFPLMMWPFVTQWGRISFYQLLTGALKEPGPARDGMEQIVIFVLMLIALVLPVKSFARRSNATDHTLSAHTSPAVNDRC